MKIQILNCVWKNVDIKIDKITYILKISLHFNSVLLQLQHKIQLKLMRVIRYIRVFP